MSAAGRVRARRSALLAWAWLAALSALPAVAAAQQEVTVLTLEEALARAARHNPQYRQALNRVELAGPQARQAWGAFLPNLSLSYNTGQSFSRRSTAFDNFDNPIERQDVKTIKNSSASQGASIAVDVFQGGRRFHDLARARAQAEMTRRAGDRELNGIQAVTRRHFLAAQRQKAKLAVEEELLAERERDMDLARSRFEIAAIGRSDVLAAQLDLEAQQTAVNNARAALGKALYELRANLGDPSLGEIDVDGAAPRVFDPAELDVDELVARAMEASPRVDEARASLSVQQASLRSEKATRWPTLTVTGSFRRSSYASKSAALFDMSPRDVSGGVSVSMSVPIFRQFQTSFAIAQADVEMRNATESIRQIELDVERQVRVQFVDLESAWRSATELARRLDVAERRLAIVREEYELAVKSVEELRAAVRERASALRDSVDQSYEFAAVLVSLHEAAGLFGRPGAPAPETVPPGG